MLCQELPPRIYQALKARCCLAASKKPQQAQEMAAVMHLPPAQMAKVLQQMTWAGLVKSRRGSNGGFWLLNPAAHIRVTDVVAFLSHPIHPKENEDPLMQALAGATARCGKEFSRITVADLAKMTARKRPSRKLTPKSRRMANTVRITRITTVK